MYEDIEVSVLGGSPSLESREDDKRAVEIGILAASSITRGVFGHMYIHQVTTPLQLPYFL